MKNLILLWVAALYILFFNVPISPHAQSIDIQEFTSNTSPAGFIPYVVNETKDQAKQTVLNEAKADGLIVSTSQTQDNCKDGKPSEIVGSAPDPCPGKVLTYSVNANPDFTSYEWEMPRSNTGNVQSDWMILSGQGTNAIRVRAGQKNGTIKLTVNHKRCGTSVQTVPVQPKNGCIGTCSAPTGLLTGPAVVCYLYEDEEKPYVFKVENPQENLTYDFILPEGFIEVSRGEDSVSAVTFFIPGEADSVQTVMLVTSNDCNSSISTLNVTLRDQNCDPGEPSGPGEPLPVELVSFGGVSRNGSVELSWSTATEINNDYFEVQRSENGKDFTVLGTVKGAGNSNTLLHYRYIDRQTSSGILYYRLKQVDVGLTHEYSKVIAVHHATKASQDLHVALFPNPVTEGNLTLKINQLPAGVNELTLAITDVHGKVLYKANVVANEQDATFPLKDLGLRKGLYLVSVTAPHVSQIHRVVVQ